MIIKVKVKPNSKSNLIEKIDDQDYDYLVQLKASPNNGKANLSLIKILQNHFKTSAVIIKTGSKSKYKLIEIE